MPNEGPYVTVLPTGATQGVDSDGDSGFFDDFVLKASEDVPVEEAGPSRTVAVGGGGGEAEGEDGGEGASDVSSEPDVGGAVGPSGKRLPFDAQR